MATVTGLTAARMLEIERKSIVAGAVDLSGNLTFTNYGGATLPAGNIKGPKGDVGDRGLTGDPGKDGTNGVDGRDGIDANYTSTELLTNVNLDTIIVPGIYVQSANARASTALNYPQAVAGLLEVYTNRAGSILWQRYTHYLTTAVWIRSYINTWNAWSLVSVDTGAWTPIVFNSGYKVYGVSYPCAWRVDGNKVFFKGLVGPTSGAFPASTTATNVFNIPQAVRPTQNGFMVGSVGPNQTPVNIVMANTGTVDFRVGGTAAAFVSLDNCWYYMN